ncbi:uncharacterized protein BDW70DRAFT_158129 [Aspergillus foveolatus]|uniref:uncharacterized protein n=1 Tax=Aspergillus foveolatus TaxID=210207 RepID=UPI003CCD5267
MSHRHQPPPLREHDLGPPRKQPFGLTVDTKGGSHERPPYHGDSGEPQSSWRSRDQEYRTRHAMQESPSTSFQNVDLASPLGSLNNRPSSPCPSVTRAWAQERPAPMVSPVPIRAQGMHRPHTPPALMRSPMTGGGSFEEGMCRRSGGGNNTEAPDYPSHHAQPPQGYGASAESVSGCPPQIAVRKRHQRPRKDMITNGEQSVHLGEMHIHRVLASSGSTSHIQPQNHPLDENRSSSCSGAWNQNRCGALNGPPMPPIWDAAETKLSPALPGSIQDLRSPYSPKTSILSAGFDHDEPSIPSFSQGSSGNVPARQPYLPSEYAAASTAAAEEARALKSKFTERFSSDRSINHALVDSHGSDASIPPRRISIGWMSEGRRIGYGYTLVSPDSSSEPREQTLCGPAGSGICKSVDIPKGTPAGSIMSKNSVKQRSPMAKEDSKGLPKTNRSSFDLSSILQKFNFSRWAASNFALKSSNNSDAGSCDSGGSSLFGILTNKKKVQPESNQETENPWEFCSWIRPMQTSGQQAPHQGSVGSSGHAEAQLLEKLATLRRRGGAWATKRKVSELARNLEKRADRAVANIAASDRVPVAQRTATRVLRLKASASREGPRGLQSNGTAYSGYQFDGHQSPQVRPPMRTSTGSSGDWDSLYEECLERCSIPE